MADTPPEETEKTRLSSPRRKEMKTNRTNPKTLLTLSAAFAVLMIFGLSSDAQAFSIGHHGRHGCHGRHHRSHLGIGFNIAPRPSGHYQTVTETIMVAPQRIERFWVPAEYTTVKDPSGNVQTIKVRDGYMAERVIPAQYQTVTRQVWVQSSAPSVGIGFGFRF